MHTGKDPPPTPTRTFLYTTPSTVELDLVHMKFSNKFHALIQIVHISKVGGNYAELCILPPETCSNVSNTTTVTHRIPAFRDDTKVIFRRFTGSLFASIISAVVAQLWRPKNMDPFEYLGLRLQGLLPAFMLPLLLTTAPLCEEMVFRCCMVSVAASCFQPFSVVLLMPIYFAAAHLHHALDKTDFVCGWRQILRVHCDRLIITYLFGVYNTFIYLRTHHFISAFVCHALCNFIGFPEPEMYYSLKARWKRSLVLYLTFIGILLWMMSLYPLTNPTLYGNKLFVL
ncbi:CAAX prenyl protease 2 [Trichinella pseudospiralis]|uniref:CAAX prenyl protease 2 n=1 Tax=Trichinella pseudospiralis TaxID=6337 RepID=A0A0V1G2N1_TRIPS|nr:CAAX prenyl protease 2 [Trichinella pseudospiralis]